MKHFILMASAMFAMTVLAQTPERVREIRAMYAQAQQTLKEQSETPAINWSVKTTVMRNEAAVGVVRYEHEYYPLHLLQSHDFVRSKRYMTVYPPSCYEILYDGQLPAFYYQRDELEDGVYEYRIYWDRTGEVCEYLPQRVVDGRKEKLDYDGIGMWMRCQKAWNFALQEYKRGTEGYETDDNGIGAPAYVNPQSREGLYQGVNQIYDCYFAVGPLKEYDPEEPDDEVGGLGKMSGCVTDEFNEAYSLCVSKSESTGELFHDYDIWVNAQDVCAKGIAGVDIQNYTDANARVTVRLWNCDSESTVILDLRFVPERSAWLVSDFISPRDGSSYMARMQRFLSE